MNQLTRTLTSLEVAEMVGREHYDVMKDIRRIISHLGEGTSSVTYFIESEYADSQGKKRPCFNLTKKGCELYGTRMNGGKGTRFAVQYIERFNQMEQQQYLQPKSQSELIAMIAQDNVERDKVIKTIKSDVSYLMDNMRLSKSEEIQIQRAGKAKVIQSLGGIESNAYRKIGSRVFPQMWGDFKRHFVLPRYSELPKVQFEEGLEFISEWTPSTSLRLEIRELNNQQHLKLVD